MLSKLFKRSSKPSKVSGNSRPKNNKSGGDRSSPKGRTLERGAKPKPKPNPKSSSKPVPNGSQLNKGAREVVVPTNAKASDKPNVKREFQYTKPLDLQERTKVVDEVKVETVTDERLISERPVLDTVTDLNEISLFQKISLVNYFNLRESGKIDERLAREEYRRNTEILKKETSLLYFLRESARRQLEHNEVKGYRYIDIRIDPKFSLQDIQKCLESKLLASYHIEVIHNNDLLSKMGVDPITIRMSLKKM